MCAKGEQAMIAAAVVGMPQRDLAELYDNMGDDLTAGIFRVAEEALQQGDPLLWSKLQGLATLDDFNAVDLAHGRLLFLIGVEYGRRLARDYDSPIRGAK